MVNVEEVDIKDILAVDCRRVDFFIELSGIERGVMKVADGEGDGVGGRRSKVVPSPHEILGEASALASAARGLTTPSAAVPIGVGVGSAVVVVRHVVGR
jgi:hypothetical protein